VYRQPRAPREEGSYRAPTSQRDRIEYHPRGARRTHVTSDKFHILSIPSCALKGARTAMMSFSQRARWRLRRVRALRRYGGGPALRSPACMRPMLSTDRELIGTVR
jgi:hypothetical protein